MADREDEEAVGVGEDQGAAGGEEEDTGAQVAPVVRLEEVAVSTGEENEEVLIDLKAKLFRYDQEGKAWKERGVGVVKILKHNESRKIRVLMRQNKTLKICANHYLIAGMNLQEHAGSEKSWVWYARDYSDGELKNELLCIRFGSVENAQKFKDIFNEATEEQSAPTSEQKSKASEIADSLDNLSVKDLAADQKKLQPTTEAADAAADATTDK